mgnify:CR=1 FL=1
MAYDVTFIPGDGTGPELAEATRRVLEATGVGFNWDEHPAGEDVYASVEWARRTAKISAENGDAVFEQPDVEVPESWSAIATNIVASKYFRGHLGSPTRESSVKQLIGRVVETLRKWGRGGLRGLR